MRQAIFAAFCPDGATEFVTSQPCHPEGVKKSPCRVGPRGRPRPTARRPWAAGRATNPRLLDPYNAWPGRCFFTPSQGPGFERDFGFFKAIGTVSSSEPVVTIYKAREKAMRRGMAKRSRF